MKMRLFGLAIGCAVAGYTTFATAEEDSIPAAKPPAVAAEKEQSAEKAPAEKAADPDLAAAQQQFDQVLAEWKDGLKELTKLQEAYRTADEAEQLKLEGEFNSKRTALSSDVRPRLVEAAKALFKLQGKANADVETFLRNILVEKFAQDRWQEMRDLSNLLRAGGVEDPHLDLLDAISSYGLHDFDNAAEKIKKAAEAGALQPSGDYGQKIPESVQRRLQLGQNVLRTAREYQQLWKEEQRLRAAEAEADDLPRVKLETNKGDIVIELFENEAPNTVANFISLVEKGFYDGLVFHRVLPGFMAQGGCPRGDGSGGPGYNIPCECYKEGYRRHFTGSLSMAKGAERDTGGSQFFLTFLPTPHLNGMHTVFGRIIEGLEVLPELQRVDPNAGQQPQDKILKATVLRKRNHVYKPQIVGQ